MNRPFRIATRATMVLLILLGVALTVHSVKTHQPGRHRVERPAETANTPTPAAQNPPASDQQATEADAANEGGSARGSGGMQPEFERFQWKQEDVSVTGEQWRNDPASRLTQIVSPRLTVPLPEPAEEGTTTEPPEEVAQITAETGNLDEEAGLAHWAGKVLARGKDFEVKTDSLSVKVSDKTATSDAKVTIERYRIEDDGTRTPAMVVNGEGIDINLPRRVMTLNRDVTARLYEVSRDFFAAEGDEAIRDVVIACSGRMEYEHLSRRVTFSDSVHVVSGSKSLRCDKLIIRLTETQEGKGRLAVNNVLAQGNVRLEVDDQMARGDTLEWQDVTQNGVLTGERCTLETDDFRLTGQKLSFYKMNSIFMCEGPGDLLWRSGDGGDSSADDVPEVRRAGPIELRADEPVRVTWTQSMTYDVAARSAVCRGNVVGRQNVNSLKCESLELYFSAEGGLVNKLIAREKVAVQDQWTDESRQVLCDVLTWDRLRNTIELKATEGKAVDIRSGRQQITSAQVIFDQARNALDCPTAGTLTVFPEGDAGEDGAITVRWEKTMHFEDAPSRTATFTGSVDARKSGEGMGADSLVVRFDEEWKPILLAATGNASIESIRALMPAPAGARAAMNGATAPLTPDAIRSGANWRMTAEAFTIEPPRQLLSSSRPGKIIVASPTGPERTITWQKSMTFDQAKGSARFLTDVRTDVDGSILETDDLTIDFNADGQLRHIRAVGTVHFTAGGEESWELASNTAEAFFVAESELKHFIARGDVELHDAERTLNCEVLQLFFVTLPGEERPAIDRAIASNNVRLRYERDTQLEAGGDQLEWNRESDLYVLTGSPNAYLDQGIFKVESQRIVLDRLSGQMQR